MSNFLVTGACGYVGSTLADFLVKKGHFVRSIDVIDPTKPIPGVEYIKGSICDEEMTDKALRGIDAVFHNAVYIPYLSKGKMIHDVNIHGLENLLEGCLKHSVRKVIITSSSCVYGTKSEMPVINDCKPVPTDIYGHVRLLAEDVAASYANKGINIVTFRPHLIAGPGRKGIFTSIFNRIAENRNLWLPASVRYAHHFIHLDDFVNALWCALEYPGSDTFNIGSQTGYTLEQLILESISKIGSKSRIRIIPGFVLKLSEVVDKLFGCSILGSHRILTSKKGFLFDCTYINEKLNWNAKYSDYDTWFECFDWFIRGTKHNDKINFV